MSGWKPEGVELRGSLEALHGPSSAWAMACCGYHRAEADEVLQSAYLKAFTGAARFRGESSLKTWWFAVIRRTAGERRRRQWLQRLALARWVQRNGFAGHAPPPEVEVTRAEDGERVRRLLQALSPRQREVVELVFFHEMTVVEAAKVLGVSVGSARRHYARAKAQLLRRWRSEEGES